MRAPGYLPEGIGSRIPLSPRALAGPPPERFPWPPGPRVALETGRAAIGWLLDALGLVAGDRALLPAYVCEAAVAPFRIRGLALDFYRVGPDLVPDPNDARARLTPRTRVLLAVHYFGFPLEEAVLAGMPAGDRLVRLEDWVQGSLTRRAYAAEAWGEYRVLAYHKLVGVPDSGLLVRSPGTPPPPRDPPLRAPRAAFFGRRLAAKALKAACVALAGGAPRPLYRPLFDAAEAAADAGVPARMSSLSKRILDRTPAARVVSRRRDNFRRLADALRDRPEIRLLRSDLPEGVCPLGLPVLVPRRDAVLQGLLARRVYAAVHWRLPAAVDPAAYPEAAALAAEELTLPIDQRYGAENMAYVARALGEALRGADGGRRG